MTTCSRLCTCMQLMCSGCWGTHLCKQAWFQFSSTSLLITFVNNRTDKGYTQSPCVMTKSCWHALLETLCMHSSGNKLTHTYAAQYRSNPQLGMHCSRAHQAFNHLLSSQCKWASLLMLSQTMSCRRSAEPVRQAGSDSHGQLHPDAGGTL